MVRHEKKEQLLLARCNQICKLGIYLGETASRILTISVNVHAGWPNSGLCFTMFHTDFDRSTNINFLCQVLSKSEGAMCHTQILQKISDLGLKDTR